MIPRQRFRYPKIKKKNWLECFTTLHRKRCFRACSVLYFLRFIFCHFIPLTIWDAEWTRKRRARRDRRCRRSNAVGTPRYQASRVASSSPPSSSSSIQQAGDRESTSHANHRATRPICPAIAASKQRRSTTPTSASRAAPTSALTAVTVTLLIAFVVHSSTASPMTPLIAVTASSWLPPTACGRASRRRIAPLGAIIVLRYSLLFTDNITDNDG